MKRYLFSLLLIATTALFNSCQKEASFENSDIPSAGLLQSDISGVCAPMTVSGIYEAGTPLVAADNYIDIEVDVAVLGSYTIYSDTLNGIYFRATGTFTTIGLNTIRLPGTGTPTAAGTHNFVITYGLSQCTVDVATLPDGGAVPAVFELEGDPGTCLSYNLFGAYTTGVALTAANKVEISVDVTTIGTYNITTIASNGITFSGSGVLPATGPAIITLTASGTPTTAGSTNVLVTDGTTTCSFQVDVTGPAVYTVDCGGAVVSGTFVKGVSAAGNSVDVPVTVTSVGTYTLSGTINGVTFTKTATFTATGAQTVNLPASGTPINDGPFDVTLSGGTGTCTFPITVIPAPTGAATFSIQCGSQVPNGTYTQGVALTTTNTVTITVNVTVVGTYAINGSANGMTFTKTGVFGATGSQTIDLIGTGTPTTAGPVAIPLTGVTPACSINIAVVPAGPVNAVFTFQCPAPTPPDELGPSGLFIQGMATSAATHSYDITVNVTTPGAYTITGAANGVTFSKTGTFAVTGPANVTLDASGTPTASGTFPVTLSGGTGTSCNFDLFVFAQIGDWSFTQGATNWVGKIVTGGFRNLDPPLPAPARYFFIGGSNQPNDVVIIELIDIDGTINAGETYVMQEPVPPAPADNLAAFTFQAGTGTPFYIADPANNPTNMVVTVSAHNAVAKTISGSFTGNAINQANNAVVPITNGSFSFTYQ